jgi:hypothetical protein
MRSAYPIEINDERLRQKDMTIYDQPKANSSRSDANSNSVLTQQTTSQTRRLLRQRVVVMPGTAVPTNVPAQIAPAPALDPDIEPRQKQQRPRKKYGPPTRCSARTRKATVRYQA